MPGRDGRRNRLGAPDRGSSIVEFSLIAVLLVMLLFAVLQVAVLFYVRSVTASAAADGARYGANSGVDAAAGGARATELIGKALSGRLAAQLPCTGAEVQDQPSGLLAAQVTCRGRIRSIFLPIGAFVSVDVTGSSMKDGP